MKRKILQKLGHLSWLRFGVRDRIIRNQHNPDTSESEDFVVPFYGATYRGNFDTFIDWSVYYYGAYCGEELRFFEDFLEPMEKPVLMDVGANIGHHTLFSAMRALRVLSFEPFMKVSQKLEQKIADNQLTNVTLFKCALGERNETAQYAKPPGHNTGTGSFISTEHSRESIDLPIRNGDELLAENKIEKVDFIKIDTEGFEPFVLKGLKKTLEKSRPVVFFEWSQNERDAGSRDNLSLFPNDYTFFHFISDTVVMYFFRKPTYSLRKRGAEWSDGNLIAVPNEYIESVLKNHPSSNAARQIRNAR